MRARPGPGRRRSAGHGAVVTESRIPLGVRIRHSSRRSLLGETVQVLIESYKHGRWEGLTDNYVRVELDGLPDHPQHDWQNTLVKARLTQLVDEGVLGVVIE